MTHSPYHISAQAESAFLAPSVLALTARKSHTWGNERVIGALVLLGLLVLRLVDPSPIWHLRAIGFDLVQRLAGPVAVDDNLVIVDIDDRSLAQLGQWPWPRTRLAELTRRLEAAGARVIGYDILFGEEDRLSPSRVAAAFEGVDPALAQRIRGLPDHDAQFASAMSAAAVVIGQAGTGTGPLAPSAGGTLSTIGVSGCDPAPFLASYPGLIAPLPALAEAAAGRGLLNAAPDSDGIIRRLPLVAALDRTIVPSFVAEIVRVASGNRSMVLYCNDFEGVTGLQIGNRVFRTDWDGALWLNARAQPPVRSIPAAAVLAGAFEASEISNRIVLVGSSAAGLGDTVSTASGQTLPGVAVLAHAIGAMIADSYPIRTATSILIDVALVLVMGAIVILIFALFEIRTSITIVAALLIAFVVSLALLFQHSRYLFDVSYPVLTAVLLSLQMLYYGYSKKEQEIESYSVLIRRRDMFMRCIVDNSLDGLVAVDGDGVILTVNPAAARMMRLPIDDLVGQRLEPRLFGGALRADVPKATPCTVQGLLAKEMPCEIAIVQEDGSSRYLEIAATAMQQDQSLVYIVTLRDITARRNAEIAARKSEQRLSDAVDSLHEGFAFWDKNGTLIKCNNQFLELLPSDERSIEGKSYEHILQTMISQLPAERQAPGDLEEQDRFQSLIEAHVTGRTVEIPLSNGRWVLASDRHMADGGIVSLRTDVTELKMRELDLTNATIKIEQQAQDLTRLAEDLREALNAAHVAQHEAEASSRAKSEFLAMMSHELRTPLNAIIGFSSVMLEQTFGPIGNPRYESYVNGINESGQSLLNVINLILDLAKIESGTLELWEDEIEIVQLIESCHTIIRRQAEATGVLLSLKVAPPVPRLHCDKRLVQAIVMNLVANGVKFTSAGGEVTVTVDSPVGEGLTIIVADTGIGIAPHNIERVLRPFEQADSSLSPKYEGTGLGLPLAKAATEKHGGHFTLTSVPGEGTVAKVIFPEWRVRRDASA